ncbi:MAG: hypothetical protein ACI4JM_05220 [Oscillospiraceae bacterium]
MRTGTFGGFSFDPEVFSDYMTEQPTWKNAIIQSGILADDPTILQLIGTKGNVGTMPFYSPIDIADNAPLNNDGMTDNTPVEISGGKQTFMLIQRMKAWKSKDFTKELTGADPMTHVSNSIANYYQQVWQEILMSEIYAVMGISAMSSHVVDITSSDSGVSEDNKATPETLIYLKQRANGDKAEDGNLLIMNSMILARYSALGLVEYDKYTIPNSVGSASQSRITSIGNDIVICDDRGTVDLTGDIPVYRTYIVGKGAFLTADKTLEKPYYTDYDPETSAGIEKIYTKQSKVLHPNGFSFAADNVSGESPSLAELSNSSNWSLKYDPKNIRIAMLKTNG